MFYEWYNNNTLIAVIITTSSCTCCFTTTIDFITEDEKSVQLQCRNAELFINKSDLRQNGNVLYTDNIELSPLTSYAEFDIM